MFTVCVLNVQTHRHLKPQDSVGTEENAVPYQAGKYFFKKTVLMSSIKYSVYL